jgi:hypothetical protein
MMTAMKAYSWAHAPIDEPLQPPIAFRRDRLLIITLGTADQAGL